VVGAGVVVEVPVAGAVVVGAVEIAPVVVAGADVDAVVAVPIERRAGAAATPTTKSNRPTAPAISLRDGTSAIMAW
jgi:hypothetical protein